MSRPSPGRGGRRGPRGGSWSAGLRWGGAVCGVSLGLGCSKVPLYDVGANFALADAAWFAEEETLFIFYDLEAQQGLGAESVMEIRYRTDTEDVDWTDITTLPTVHRHVPVDCGPTGMCGSTSLAVPDEPRDVGIRLRYHRDGVLAREADTVFNVVGPGPDHTHRSLLVYGVFDESNRRVQWRGRHRFPTVRNQRASALGLRRWFEVADTVTGTDRRTDPGNPYLYGTGCPDLWRAIDHPPVSTDLRAVFDPEPLPLASSSHAQACGLATVEDARGTFTTSAIARKNPQVRPAFPVLRSPVKDATPIQFFLAPCGRSFDRTHEAMQRQRLQMAGVETTCIDDWDRDTFVEELAGTFAAAVEAARPYGDDMVLVVGLHRDEDGPELALEEALARFVPDERHRSSPRLAGAFVLDTDVRVLALDELDPVVLWCPASLPGGGVGNPNTASLTCAVAPDEPDFELGPFTFGTLPILPSREMYNDFIDTYSERQAGEVRSLSYRAPRFATTADHQDLGEFGVVTFLNDERISAQSLHRFSYCPDSALLPVVFRSPLSQDPTFQAALSELCDDGTLPEDFCFTGELGVLPLALLPEWHGQLFEDDYELGLFWDFPFLLRMRFEAVAAGSVSALGLSVPFGLADTGQTYLGTTAWLEEELWLEERLTQCTRFCTHPVFDSAGVYQVGLPFWPTFSGTCFTPAHPAPGDGGFPRDP